MHVKHRCGPIHTCLTLITSCSESSVDLHLPDSSLHRVGFLPCCSTVYQPGEYDKICTGSNCRGKSCLRPLLQVQKEPQASDRSHTPLYCIQISNAKADYDNMWAVKTEQIKA